RPPRIPNGSPNGKNNERKRPQSAGARRDSAPDGTVKPDSPHFCICAKYPCHDARSSLRLPHGKLAVRTGDNHSLTVLGSLDFQTCRIADSSKSAGREVALEVGLETCAAAVRPRDVTHN